MRKLYSIIFLLLILCACDLQRHQVFWHKRPVPCIKRVVVIGFRPARSIFEGSSYMRCPISGNTFKGSIISDEVLSYMTELLLKHLSKDAIFSITYPQEVKKEFLDLNETLDNADRNLLLQYLRQIGLAFNADAVIIGHVFRWQERAGSDYASSRPASVAFDIHIVGTEKGGLLWNGEFNKTQTSLTENLLDIKTFIKGKGRWMTAEELADMGLSSMVKKIIKTQRGCKK